MSAGNVGWVFDHSPYSGARFVLHLALGDIANDTYHDEIWASLPTLATKARQSPSSARTSLATMVADGYLELIEMGGGRSRPSRYRLLKPSKIRGVSEEGETPQPDALNPPISGPKPPNPEDRPLSNGSDPKEQPKLLSLGEVLDPFLAFWDRYPRHVAKPQAAIAYAKALKRASAEEILAGVEAHRPAWLAREKQYIPHPTTWLNRDGWADDPPTPAVARSGRSGPAQAPIMTDRTVESGRIYL